jgi:hypothetical protein
MRVAMPHRLLRLFPTGDRIVERITDVIASIGVLTWFTPGLYEWTASISHIAALFMPILGSVWLSVQIVNMVRGWIKGK